MRFCFSLTSLVLLTFSIIGCQPLQTADYGEAVIDRPIQNGGMTAYQLAAQLGLQVTDSAPTHYTLKNSSNTVMLFTHTEGQFYVNGRAIGEVGTVTKQNGLILFDSALVPRMRAALVSGGTAVSTWSRSKSGIVVLDPGHGGKDPGAIACNGVHEKVINLSVARQVASLLRQKGIKVVMTRSSDTFVDLEDRAAIANRHRADLFVSIHADSNQNSQRRGFSVFIARRCSVESRQTARKMLDSLGKSGLQNQGLRQADYRVLVKTKCPAVLVEMGHLSNWREAGLLSNSGFQSRMASAIAEGVYNSL